MNENKMHENDIRFIMKLGGDVRNLIFTRLAKDYKSDKVIQILFDFLANFVCNTFSEVSLEGATNDNIKAFIKTLELWMKQDRTESIIKKVKYNRMTDALNIEDIH